MNKAVVNIGNRKVGDGEKTFIAAEIGINHNGSVDIAKLMIDGAVEAGADCVKFQKRTPEICVPKAEWDKERDTPWGRMRYIDYKHKIEFGEKEYGEIHRYCREKGIMWTASCWDVPSIQFMEKFEPPFYKAASASLTDHDLLLAMKKTGRPLMISTGMSDMTEIREAVAAIGHDNLLIAHATSAYPSHVGILNLRMIPTLKAEFPDVPIGYSGHETGLVPTWSAVTLGATFVERHVTLDRAMWGTDQAASVEMGGLRRLVSNIRDIERALGDGVKKIYEEEVPIRAKLRGH